MRIDVDASQARRLALSLLGMSLLGGTAAATPLFQGLGDLPGGAFESVANDLSVDGTAVVGRSEGADGDEAFLWSRATGMGSLGPGEAFAVSGAGGAVAGRGFRWNAVEGRVDLPRAPFASSSGFAFGLDMTIDGSKIVGTDTSPPFSQTAALWQASNGFAFQLVSPPADAGFEIDRASLVGVSADGSLSVLTGASELGFLRGSFLLDSIGGSMPIGDFAQSVDARAIAADGSLVVGQFRNGNFDHEAFVWSPSFALVGLGDLPDGDFDSDALAVAPNGTVVGRAHDAAGVEAFVWDPIRGMRSLHDDLVGRGVDLTGWTLQDATGISFDGQTIVGNGIDPDGNPEAWIVVLPEPGTAATLALGLAVLARTRRRRR